MYRQLKGALLVLLSACGLGVGPLLALYSYQSGTNVPTLLLLRFTLAALFLLSFILVSRRNFSGLRAKELFYIFLLGGVCHTISSTFYFTAIRYITASLATMILYIYPIFVVLMDCMLKRQKPTLLNVLSVVISFAGVLLILGASYGVVDDIGVLLALGAALGTSIFVIMGNRIVKQVAPLTVTAFVNLFAGVGILITSTFTTSVDFSFRPAAWPYIVGLALFSTVIAMLALFRGLEIIGPVRTSILSMSEPLFTMFGSVILFQERLTAVQFIGGATVIVGAVLVTWPKIQGDRDYY